MIDKIIDALKKENVAVWQINSTQTKRAELYFIKKKLDIPRMAEMKEYAVAVYNDFEENGQKFRGVSSCFIEEGQSEDEIRAKIKNAYYAAKFVKNKFYELPDPTVSERKPSRSDMAGKNISEIANAFADAVLSLPTDGQALVNSLEIFVYRKEVEIVASTGLHVSYGEDRIDGEYVTQCISPVDVEQYRQFAYNNFDTEALKKSVMTAISDAKKRAEAKSSPKKGTYDVLLTGENLKAFFEYYTARGNASVIYPGYSTWKKGDVIQKSGSGEKLCIDMLATAPYSNDGIEMKDMKFIENGKLMSISGPTRFMRYLNEKPTGTFGKICVKNGSMRYEDMKKEGVLETISFSDFQMDFFTGNFGGEMRLATIRENGKDVPLFGGSINGKLPDIEDKMIFSVEKYEDNEYSGPYALLIPGIPVAGV